MERDEKRGGRDENRGNRIGRERGREREREGGRRETGEKECSGEMLWHIDRPSREVRDK